MAISAHTVAELSRLYGKRTKIRAAMEHVTKPGAIADAWLHCAVTLTAGNGSLSDMAYALADGDDLDNWLKEAALERLKELDRKVCEEIGQAGGEV